MDLFRVSLTLSDEEYGFFGTPVNGINVGFVRTSRRVLLDCG
jgi:hypothetical protein